MATAQGNQKAEITTEQRDDAEIVEVKEGTVIVRAEQPDTAKDEDEKSDSWFVLADNVALRGTEVKEPEQNFDQGPGGSGQPIVTFKFTDDGPQEVGGGHQGDRRARPAQRAAGDRRLRAPPSTSRSSSTTS